METVAHAIRDGGSEADVTAVIERLISRHNEAETARLAYLKKIAAGLRGQRDSDAAPAAPAQEAIDRERVGTALSQLRERHRYAMTGKRRPRTA